MTEAAPTPPSSLQGATRLVAFYLPQFHPIPENDASWGMGFTEWTNVTRATALFPGHRQPHLPADLGFYDLRVPEVREQQAALARAYGIHGFCYYYYWFAGRRLLERPLDEVLASGRPELPFCVCWANENWTRRWDGAEHEVLIGQEHTVESDSRFIHDVIPTLRDPRYIRLGGKPVLLVYRPDLLPDSARVTEIWREGCRAQGIPEIHLVAAQTFGCGDPRPLGFDAAAEFPPHGIYAHPITRRVPGLQPGFAGKIYDYRDAVEFGIKRPDEPYHLHRGVMVRWDNTPRRGPHAHIWHHATPEEYERWLRAMIRSSRADPSDDAPIVFINAWNEWAESAYLEPDRDYGHAYLQATRRALLAGSGVPARRTHPGDHEFLSPDELRDRLGEIEEELRRYQRANAYFRAELEARDAMEGSRVALFSPDPPVWLPAGELPRAGRMSVEEIDLWSSAENPAASLGRRIRIAGWTVGDEVDPKDAESSAALILHSCTDDRLYFARVGERTRRADLAMEERGSEVPSGVGFSVTAWCDVVEPGPYEIGMIQRNRSRTVVTMSGQTIRFPDGS